MGLRVGAGPGALSQPGAPQQTLAGMQQAGALPSNVKVPQMKQAAKSAAPNADAMADEAIKTMEAMPDHPNVAAKFSAPGKFDDVTLPTGIPGYGMSMRQLKDGMNGAPSSEPSIIEQIAHHPAEVGLSTIGGFMGSRVPILGKAASPVLAGAGAAAGKWLDAQFVNKDAKSLSWADMARTGVENAFMQFAGQKAHNAIAGTSAPEVALNPKMESEMAPVRQGAKEMVNTEAGRQGLVRKSQVAPGTLAGNTNLEQEQLAADGYLGPLAQKQMEAKITAVNSMHNDVTNIRRLMPKPQGDYNIGELPEQWRSGLETKFVAAKNRALGDGGSIFMDPRKLTDSLMAVGIQEGLIDANGKPTRLPPESPREVEAISTRRKLQNFIVSSNEMLNQGGKPDQIVGAIHGAAAEKFQGVNAKNIPPDFNPFQGAIPASLESSLGFFENGRLNPDAARGFVEKSNDWLRKKGYPIDSNIPNQPSSIGKNVPPAASREMLRNMDQNSVESMQIARGVDISKNGGRSLLDSGDSDIKKPDGFVKLSLKDADWLKQTINQIADGSSPKSSANLLRKTFYDGYYSLVSDMADKAGHPEAAREMRDIGSQLNLYHASTESIIKGIKENPSLAVDQMFGQQRSLEEVKQMTGWMTKDQWTATKDAFVANALSRGQDQMGNITAGSVKNYLNSFGNDKLSIALGPQKQAIMQSLTDMERLQNTNLQIGAQKGILDRVVKAVTLLPKSGAWWTVLKSLVKNPDVESMMATPEYADKLYRTSKLAGARNITAAAVGKGIPLAGSAYLATQQTNNKFSNSDKEESKSSYGSYKDQ